MQLTLATIAYATFLWWFSTGLIFFLNARPARTFRWSMLGGSMVLLGALYGLWASAGSETVGGAMVAFTCGLLIWGWHTMSYYMGVITGPRRQACPAGSRGFKRFGHALATSIYHELAIIATVGLMLWLTWGQNNRFGLWTFLLLWGMHVSAKLNVFLGVRNLNVEFIPERLSYLSTYFRHKPMNLLFPFSVTAGTIISVLLVQQVLQADPGSAAAVGFILLASLMALAVIEHWFMILPIQADALWRWSLKASNARGRRPASAEPKPGLAKNHSDAQGGMQTISDDESIMKIVASSANP
ncbi:MAG: putative photosynthetic complex assembly protein PuhE [Wenzhouxiangella sp.]